MAILLANHFVMLFDPPHTFSFPTNSADITSHIDAIVCTITHKPAQIKHSRRSKHHEHTYTQQQTTNNKRNEQQPTIALACAQTKGSRRQDR
jgi:hypothetical protein